MDVEGFGVEGLDGEGFGDDGDRAMMGTLRFAHPTFVILWVFVMPWAMVGMVFFMGRPITDGDNRHATNNSIHINAAAICSEERCGHPRSRLRRVADHLNKADPNAAHKEMRTFGTLGALRHEIRDRGTRFRLCQFRPELVYSPWAMEAYLSETGVKAKASRIDLVPFVNGFPVATMELKSEFKQAVGNAIKQYKRTRLPVDPVTKKREPLLTFKRGALAVETVS